MGLLIIQLYVFIIIQTKRNIKRETRPVLFLPKLYLKKKRAWIVKVLWRYNSLTGYTSKEISYLYIEQLEPLAAAGKYALKYS